MSKKYPNEFYLVFDPQNKNQIRAYELLNTKGRKKSAYITEAILFYEQHFNAEQISEPPKKENNNDKDLLNSILRFRH